MIQRLNERLRRIFDRPIRVVIDPAALCADSRFAVGIYDDLDAKMRETFRKMGHKQFSSTVIRRRYGDERRRDETDFQFYWASNFILGGERCCGTFLCCPTLGQIPSNEVQPAIPSLH